MKIPIRIALLLALIASFVAMSPAAAQDQQPSEAEGEITVLQSDPTGGDHLAGNGHFLDRPQIERLLEQLGIDATLGDETDSGPNIQSFVAESKTTTYSVVLSEKPDFLHLQVLDNTSLTFRAVSFDRPAARSSVPYRIIDDDIFGTRADDQLKQKVVSTELKDSRSGSARQTVVIEYCTVTANAPYKSGGYAWAYSQVSCSTSNISGNLYVSIHASGDMWNQQTEWFSTSFTAEIVSSLCYPGAYEYWTNLTRATVLFHSTTQVHSTGDMYVGKTLSNCEPY